ncbi:MAG TPA: amidohydrolase family protein [Acetobacteraceae bacterium]|nr:amidohydrolase family protein [Acetobacteraceae bacterium]
MRTVALEEHFTVPDLVRQIDPAAVIRRGFPPPSTPWGPMRQVERLADAGAARLQDMNAAGITVQVLSVSGPGADVAPAKEAPALARAFNDALARIVAAHPDRYAGFAHLPMTAPEAAADELERSIKELGFCGVLVNGLTEDRFLDDPRFAPVLARTESLGVPLYLHPGIPPEPVRRAYYDGLPEPLSFMLSIAGWGWHAEVAVHVLRLVLSGTLDRYPRLQLIIGHMGEGLPAMLDRCDQVFGRAPAEVLKRRPSQAIRDQVHVTTSGFFSLPPFEALLHTFGADRIMFSVDYPFSENATGRAFLDSLPVSPVDREKIAHGNADRLLKLRG